jgi:Fic family protein
LHQLSVLDRATDDLVEHLRERAQALQQLPRSAKVQGLNHRQKAVLASLMRHPQSEVTVSSHERSHGVSYLTARKDLQNMEQAGLVQRARVGKTDHYSMSTEFVRQLRKKKRS